MNAHRLIRFVLVILSLLAINACNNGTERSTNKDTIPSDTLTTEKKECETTTPTVVSESDFRSPNVKIHIKKGMSLLLETDGIALAAADTTIIHDGTYSITALYGDEVAAMPQNMTNVTAGCGNGYRLLPNGEHFEPYAELRVKYDESKIPHGYSANDIYTSYYDESNHKWTRLYRKEVDTANKEIVSLTNHFTDFVNEVLKSPEMPETKAFTPTSLTDIKAVNPLDGLTLMQPPTANSSASANLSYPIEIPAGRNGMQPSIGLNYSSTGGSGWLGIGWDIPIPVISIDSRWGVPRYDESKESEIYLLNGEQLYTMDEHGNPRPLPNRTNELTNRLGDGTQFHIRASDAHDSIIRHGNTPAEYWWEVVDRNGISYYYGQYFEGGEFSPVTLRDANGKIAKWYLAEMRDPFGNTIRYYYDLVTSNIGSNPGKQIYINHINYTGYGSDEGRYNLRFCRVPNYSADIPNVSNNGFKEITDQLLSYIYLTYKNEITQEDDILNAWVFESEYGQHSNYKVRLTSVTKIDEVSDEGGIPVLLYGICPCVNELESSVRNDETGESGDGDESGDGSEEDNPDSGGKIDNGPGTRYTFSQERHSSLTGSGTSINDIEIGYLGTTTKFEYYDAPLPQQMFEDEEVLSSDSEADIIEGFFSRLTDDEYSAARKATTLGLTHSSSWSFGGTLGIGSDQLLCLSSTSGAGSYSRSQSSSESLAAMADLDGDGFSDKIYISNGHLYFRKGHVSSTGVISFDMPHEIAGVDHFLLQSGHTNNFGLQASFGVSVSGSLSTAMSTTSTYMSDVNGDGLVDIVDNGQVLFNQLDANGFPSFHEYVDYSSSPASTEVNTSNADCGGIIFDGEVDEHVTCVETLEPVYERVPIHEDPVEIESLIQRIIEYYSERGWTIDDYEFVIEDFPDDFDRMARSGYDKLLCPYHRTWDCSFHTDALQTEAVKVWVAPHNGNITINGRIKLKQENDQSRTYSRHVDGIIHTIEHISNIQLNEEQNRFLSGYTSNIIQSISIAEDDYTTHTITSSRMVEGREENNVSVQAGDIIFFRLQSKESTAFDSIETSYRISYVGENIDYKSCDDYVISSDMVFQAPVDGTFTISSVNFVSQPGASYQINIGSSSYSYPNTIFNTPQNITGNTTIECIVSQSVSGQNPIWGDVVWKPQIVFTPNNGTSIEGVPMGSAPIETYLPVKMNFNNTDAGYMYTPPLLYNRLFGPLYKGWGQFAYHPVGDDLSNNHILLDLLIPSDMLVSGNTSSSDESDANALVTSMSSNTTESNSRSFVNSTQNGGINTMDELASSMSPSGNSMYNPLTNSTYWVEMIPDFEHFRWISFGGQNMVGKNVMSDDIPNYYNNSSTNNTTAPQVSSYDDPIPVSLNGRRVKAIHKVNTSVSLSGSLGLCIGESRSSNTNYIVSDYLDLNGDRYPDIVGQSRVQYSKPWGGLGELVNLPRNIALQNNSTTKTNGKSYSASDIFQERNTSFDPRFTKFTLRTTSSSANVSSSGSLGWDFTDGAWIDINGDGLLDFVKANGIVYQNIGYGFLPGDDWNFDTVRSGISYSLSGGFGGSFSDQITQFTSLTDRSIVQGSIEVGCNISTSINQTSKMLIDVNGDGLVDKVWRTFNDYDLSTLVLSTFNLATKVSFNLGNGRWSPAYELTNAYKFDGSTTTSEVLTAGATLGFTVFGTLKMTAGLDGSIPSGSVTRDDVQMVDVNADGYPDIIKSNIASQLTVRYNRFGKTPINLLKKVTNFTGSSISMNYEMSQPSYDQPSRTWMLASVSTHDPLNPNGADASSVQFTYENPHYDRFERTSYGYGVVKTFEMDPSDNSIYRVVEQDFHNDTYHTKGKLYRTITTDAEGHPFVEKLIENQYVGEECDNNIRTSFEVITTHFYEGMDDPQLTVRERFEYDRYHNVKCYTDYGDVNSNSDGSVVKFEYYSYLPHNLVGLQKSYKLTYTGRTEIQRHAKFEYDLSTGRMTSRSNYNGTDYSVTNFDYDQFGNQVSVTLPQDNWRNRMQYDIVYDNVLHEYPIHTSNSLGQSTSMEYNYSRGQIKTTTDICGNSMNYCYDATGRVTEIRSPLNASSNPSLVNVYYPINYRHGMPPVSILVQSDHPYSKTYHYDDSGDLITESVVIADGFGRVIQTKKGLTEDGVSKMQVSGRCITDAFGRVVEQYDPITEDYLSSRGVFNPQYVTGTRTTMEYDVLDRTTRTVDPLGNAIVSQYDIAASSSGIMCFHTKITDQLFRITHQYCDYENRKVQVTDALGNITKMVYNNLGELVQSTDPEGFSTYYTYDKLGRIIRRNHPDAGVSTCVYDNANNLLSQTNPLGTISFNYHYGRPTEKIYSDFSENNVYYSYGTTGNQNGRLVQIKDGTGTRNFQYDALGNITSEVRRVAIPSSRVYVFTTDYLYDSWGRLLKMTYPDGEVVQYGYNYGGDLCNMKNDDDYFYIEQISYNQFGQRSQIKYGNSTKAFYDYDILHRLSILRSTTGEYGDMQKIEYTYDAVGNITNISNTAGAILEMGGEYSNIYTYDDLSRLISADGSTQSGYNFNLGEMRYSPSGRLLAKSQYSNDRFGASSYNELLYVYCNTNKPHAPRQILDNNTNTQHDLIWDPAGNLVQTNTSIGNEWDMSRFQYWTVDNRLISVSDNYNHSYYAYDYQGERTIKLTGSSTYYDINRENGMSTSATLCNLTIYPSAFVVLSNEGMTKHYYAGAERVCARMGSSLGNISTENNSELTTTSNSLLSNTNMLIHNRVLASDGCVSGVDGAPSQMNCNINTNLSIFNSRMTRLSGGSSNIEDGVFYYHSDHLGSASWITDLSGTPIQHLQYLPFGESYVSEHAASPYTERFTFTGKEKDEETGYTYHGARYFDADLMCSWFSVDPLSDKYPSLSPYNYCAWNPVKLVDPDGEEAIEICPWYRSKSGDMVYSTKNVSKIERNGETYYYDGMTAVHGNKYYSLFGDCLDANSDQGKFTQDVDNVLINHASWRKKAKNIYCNETKIKMNSIKDNLKRNHGLPTTSENIVDPKWTYSGANVRIYQNEDKSGYVNGMISDILKRKHFDTNSSLGTDVEVYGLRIGNSALIYFNDSKQAHEFYSMFFKLFPESK